ncbi:MAG: chorismate-binding protein [Planctomycetia bacterium]|nr:chorismate-binding protein [Planctomycetia bacterium]
MLNLSYRQFEEAAKKGEIVPVFAEFLADMETPVSVLHRCCADENVFLLESVEGGERFGRYSFLGLNPRGVFTIEGGKAFYTQNFVRKEIPLAPDECPLDSLRQLTLQKKFVEVEGVPPLCGGAIGFLAYEAATMFEDLPKPAPDQTLAAFMIVDEMIAFDNIRHTIKIIICVHTNDYKNLTEAYADAELRAESLASRIRIPARIRDGGILGVSPTSNAPREKPEALKSNVSRLEFCERVERARQNIHDGECIQLVLSQRFSAPLESPPLEIYRRLRLVNPSPYMFYLKLGDRVLVGSSPETMVKLEKNCSSLRPIAGTRWRGRDAQEDIALANELLQDEKERAEHLMLVDLGRNDLGRTADPGTVQVKSLMKVERYSHVMHLVSDVEARLAPQFDAIDLIKTTFPAGTLSGAPKVRAMELIHELEGEPRGVYGGSVGYVSYNGSMDMAITIRTMEIHRHEIHIQVGAGVVFDSIPEKEYNETLNKAGALFSVVEGRKE